MTRRIFILCFLFTASYQGFCQQKTVGEATVVYDIKLLDEQGQPSESGIFKAAQKTVYIKGRQAKTELISSNFSQVLFADNHTNTAVILREVGNNKFMHVLDSAKWRAQNIKFIGMKLTETSEVKTILGYECKKLVAHLKDSTMFVLYYTTAINASAVENQYQFANVPGVVLEYEAPMEGQKATVRYTATSVSLTPVPAAEFEIPKKGYRILK